MRVNGISGISGEWVTPNFRMYGGNKDVAIERQDNGFKPLLDEKIEEVKEREPIVGTVIYTMDKESDAQALYKYARNSSAYYTIGDVSKSVSAVKGKAASERYHVTMMTTPYMKGRLDEKMKESNIEAHASFQATPISRSPLARRLYAQA